MRPGNAAVNGSGMIPDWLTGWREMSERAARRKFTLRSRACKTGDPCRSRHGQNVSGDRIQVSRRFLFIILLSTSAVRTADGEIPKCSAAPAMSSSSNSTMPRISRQSGGRWREAWRFPLASCRARVPVSGMSSVVLLNQGIIAPRRDQDGSIGPVVQQEIPPGHQQRGRIPDAGGWSNGPGSLRGGEGVADARRFGPVGEWPVCRTVAIMNTKAEIRAGSR